MNSSGSYAVVITLIAMVMIAAAAATSSSAIRAEGREGYARATAEVKREWQNFRYLLDKSTADAVADASLVGSVCEYNSTQANNNLAGYFSNVRSDSFGKDCLYSPTTPIANGSADNITVTVSITCEKSLGGGFSASYSKNVTFNKKVTVDGSGVCPDSTPRCYVVVQDKQSLINEVEQDNC